MTESEAGGRYRAGELEIGDRAILATRGEEHSELSECDGMAVEVVDTFRDTVEVLRFADPGAERMNDRFVPPVYSLMYDQLRRLPDETPLNEVGPYEESEYPHMNFECPDCGFSLCEWTDCPDCGWYGEDTWLATMAWYVDCVECEQTISVREVHLCDDCREDYQVIRSPEQGRRLLEDELGLGRDS